MTSLASRISLNDGRTMPVFGLGTFNIGDGEKAVTVCSEALELGYRLLDTAVYYGNEKEVGEAVRRSGLPREDVFVVSKILWDDHGSASARTAVRKSLEELDLGYIDLYLIHSPSGGKLLETYDALLEYRNQGLLRSIGVSNFSIDHLQGLADANRPAPAVNQIELHCWQRKKCLVQYCRDHDIALMGYSPLAKGRHADNAIVSDIASRCGKTYGQVLIRWSVQSGYITIPKTSNHRRLAENADVFDWALSDKDMALLNDVEECSVMRSPMEDIPFMP